MRIVCAWCRKTLGHRCPLCGAPLEHDPNDPSQFICVSGDSRITFTEKALSIEPTTHGICEPCADKLNAERDAARAARAADRELTPEDRANGEAEATPTPVRGLTAIEIIEATEADEQSDPPRGGES